MTLEEIFTHPWVTSKEVNFRSSKKVNTVYLKPHDLKLENNRVGDQIEEMDEEYDFHCKSPIKYKDGPNYFNTTLKKKDSSNIAYNYNIGFDVNDKKSSINFNDDEFDMVHQEMIPRKIQSQNFRKERSIEAERRIKEDDIVNLDADKFNIEQEIISRMICSYNKKGQKSVSQKKSDNKIEVNQLLSNKDILNLNVNVNKLNASKLEKEKASNINTITSDNSSVQTFSINENIHINYKLDSDNDIIHLDNDDKHYEHINQFNQYKPNYSGKKIINKKEISKNKKDHITFKEIPIPNKMRGSPKASSSNIQKNIRSKISNCQSDKKTKKITIEVDDNIFSSNINDAHYSPDKKRINDTSPAKQNNGLFGFCDSPDKSNNPSKFNSPTKKSNLDETVLLKRFVYSSNFREDKSTISEVNSPKRHHQTDLKEDNEKILDDIENYGNLHFNLAETTFRDISGKNKGFYNKNEHHNASHSTNMNQENFLKIKKLDVEASDSSPISTNNLAAFISHNPSKNNTNNLYGESKDERSLSDNRLDFHIQKEKCFLNRNNKRDTQGEKSAKAIFGLNMDVNSDEEIDINKESSSKLFQYSQGLADEEVIIKASPLIKKPDLNDRHFMTGKKENKKKNSLIIRGR